MCLVCKWFVIYKPDMLLKQELFLSMRQIASGTGGFVLLTVWYWCSAYNVNCYVYLYIFFCFMSWLFWFLLDSWSFKWCLDILHEWLYFVGVVHISLSPFSYELDSWFSCFNCFTLVILGPFITCNSVWAWGLMCW